MPPLLRKTRYAAGGVALLTVAIAAAAWARAPIQASPPARCPATVAVAPQHYPGAAAIPTINHLALPAGKALVAEGQRILLTGIVLDTQCVPVSNAVVEIWQNDPFGRWILGTPEDQVDVHPTFNGAGRSFTDNEGVFHFITLFPAATKKRAPTVNIRIAAPQMRPFATTLYFAGDRRNDSDPVYQKLPLSARGSISIPVQDGDAGALQSQFTITLPGIMPYRGY